MSGDAAAADAFELRGRTDNGLVPGYLQDAGTTLVLERGAEGDAVRRTVLPSGMRVITERMPGARSAAVGIWVGVGSRDEQPRVAGAAHYLEHLLFKGTRRRSAARIAEEIDAVGGELNAFTDKEHTCFYAHTLDVDLPLAVDLLCDVVFGATVEERHLDLERAVVLEEIAMRDDDPEDLLHEAFSAALLGDHPLGRSVLGTEESVSEMSRASLHGFYRRSYEPCRMVLAVAGNVEHEAVLRLARTALADHGHGAGSPVPPRRGELRLGHAPGLELRTDDTEQAHLMLGVRGLDRHDERRFALAVLNAALGGGMSSRLFQEVREKRGLAYQVYSSVLSYADIGSLSIYAGAQPERLGTVVDVLRTVLAEVARHGLSDAEVARAKGQLRGGLVLGLEDAGSRMFRLGKGELNYGDHLGIDATLARISAVTEAEVAEVAAELLRRPVVSAVVGPYAHPDDLPAQLHEVMT